MRYTFILGIVSLFERKGRDFISNMGFLCGYRKLGIGFIALEYKEKNIPTDPLIDSFHKSFYQAAIRYIISKEPTLELFNGKIFSDIIAKYKQRSYILFGAAIAQYK